MATSQAQRISTTSADAIAEDLPSRRRMLLPEGSDLLAEVLHQPETSMLHEEPVACVGIDLRWPDGQAWGQVQRLRQIRSLPRQVLEDGRPILAAEAGGA